MSGLFVNFDIGTGINVSSFEKGQFFKEMEEFSSGSIKWIIKTDAAPIFQLGLSIGYSISKKISVSLDCKFLFNSVRTSMTIKDSDTNYSNTSKYDLKADNFQPVLVLRYWF